jgi:proteasome lid subunit RPN8/RPN11
MGRPQLEIAADAIDAMERHVVAAAPEECCGLLLGTTDLIAIAFPARNDAAEPLRRYEINPADHFAAIRQARKLSLDVIGAYHSHPRSEPVPSPTDLNQAFAAFIFVILGPSDGPRVRAWRLDEGNFTEVPLVRCP